MTDRAAAPREYVSIVNSAGVVETVQAVPDETIRAMASTIARNEQWRAEMGALKTVRRFGRRIRKQATA